jgi:uncharacterized NAD(P)/FAD-binding protein YdhS
LLAVHLLRFARRPLEVVLIDRAEKLGRGRAYAEGPAIHLLNVRAARMSARPDEPGHFTAWLSARRPGLRSPEEAFAPRALYGEYLENVLAEAIREAAPGVTLRHLRDRIVDAEADDARLSVVLESGRAIEADHLALAPGNPPSSPPFAPAEGASWRWEDPLDPEAAEGLDPDAPVFVAGSGLSMVDLVTVLAASGHRGQIHVVSRRGLLPRAHPDVPYAPQPVPSWALPRTARGLAAALGRLAGTLGSEGGALAVESFRPITDALWAELPESERRRFVRHLLPFWNVMRHRMAPDAARTVVALRAEGRLRVTAGRIVDVHETGTTVTVEVRPRGSSSTARIGASRLFDATGPGNVLSLPLVSAVLARGLAVPHPLGLGLDVSNGGRVRTLHGDGGCLLGALGLLARGRTWESTAIPDIREQARAMAAAWMDQLG